MPRHPPKRLARVWLWAISSAVAMAAPPAMAGDLGIGRPASPHEIRAWDIDVRPDGRGLPAGRGSVSEGEKVYQEKCAACHGDFGEGLDRWPALAGGADTLKDDRPIKTLGSYWPYLSTFFDYTRRAMPFGDAQSLSADELYAVTAYVLYLNDIVDDESFVLSRDNFTSIRLPNQNNFIADPRPDTPTLADGEPCMRACKDSVTITKRASDLNVTPK